VRRVAGLLAVLTVLVYLPTAAHGFISLDDPLYVAENPVVQNGLTWAGLKWAFVGWHASNWHPLTWVSHELDCQLFGLQAGAHHLVNVLFHAANTVLLFLLWRRLTKAFWPAALVAALFAWHPLHVESVAWVAERKDVLSTLFGLLALGFYARYVEESRVQSKESKVQSPKSKVYYAASLAAFVLGLLSKPMLVTLPCVLLLLDYWPLARATVRSVGPEVKPRPLPLTPALSLGERGNPPQTHPSPALVGKAEVPRLTEPRSGEGPAAGARPAAPGAGALPNQGIPFYPLSFILDNFFSQWRPLLLEKIPFFLLSLVSCLVTFSAQSEKAVIPLQQMPLGFRLENAVVAVAAYLGNTLWPAGLGIFYPLPATYSAAAVAGSAALVAGISLLVWRARRHRFLVTGWLWFLGMLAPVIGLVQAGEQARADRYTYLPSVGLLVAVVFGLAELRARWKIPARMAGLAAVLVLGACVAVTEHQLAFWRDTETLYQHTLAVTQNNGVTHLLLGSFYEKQGRSDEARKQYHEALDAFALITVEVNGEKRSYAAQVYLLLGQSAEQKGQADAAMGAYREALRLDDKLVEAHNNLGNLLDQQGRSAEALAEYQAAVRWQPETPLVHENLGTQLVEMGRWDEAMNEYQAAARLAPADPRPAYLTGKAWLRQGRSREAAAAFENALRLDPADVPSLVYLARLLAADASPQLRNGARAVALAEQANTLTGGNQPFVLGTVAMAYAEAGRWEDARKTARSALQLLQLAGEGGKTTAALQAQLRLYDAGQPYREALTNAPGPAR